MEQGKKYDVICIGQIIQDIVVTGIPKTALMEERDSFMSEETILSTGGDAANQAVTLARLGDRTALLARLDQGSVGQMVYGEFEKEGVDTSLLVRPEDCQNITSIVMVQPGGVHKFFIGPGRNYELRIEDVNLENIKNTRVVTAGSLFGLGVLDREGIDKVFWTAKEAGAITVADMTYDMHKIGARSFDKLYPAIDYLMPSYDEAVFVTGEMEPDKIADVFLKAGVGNVVLKLGDQGCFFKNAEERFYTDPYSVKPVDTTGCGDNFVAGFVHELLKGMPHKVCTEFACGIGGLNSLGLGAHRTVQSEMHVEEFMKKTEKVKYDRT